MDKVQALNELWHMDWYAYEKAKCAVENTQQYLVSP